MARDIPTADYFINKVKSEQIEELQQTVAIPTILIADKNNESEMQLLNQYSEDENVICISCNAMARVSINDILDGDTIQMNVQYNIQNKYNKYQHFKIGKLQNIEGYYTKIIDEKYNFVFGCVMGLLSFKESVSFNYDIFNIANFTNNIEPAEDFIVTAAIYNAFKEKALNNEQYDVHILLLCDVNDGTSLLKQTIIEHTVKMSVVLYDPNEEEDDEEKIWGSWNLNKTQEDVSYKKCD